MTSVKSSELSRASLPAFLADGHGGLVDGRGHRVLRSKCPLSLLTRSDEVLEQRLFNRSAQMSAFGHKADMARLSSDVRFGG